MGRLGLTYNATLNKIGNQQGPIYSTRNSIQYSVMAYLGKESKKEWIYL